ncbi:MAG: hypothetical protein M3457_23220, partial [Chloroflexota bacterium]|nr:hypothetical protein [Chloroflexota bacterium]
MAQVAFARMRAFDVRTIGPVVWVLLAIAVADVSLRIQSASTFLGPLAIPGAVMLAAPFVFAAAVAYVAPADRRFLYGAIAIAVKEFLAILQILFGPRFLGIEAASDIVRVVGDAGWLFTLVGLLLIGRALGGVRSRRGWAAVAFGIGVFVLSDAWNASRLISNPALWELFSIEQIVIGFVGPSLVIGWAYVLGAGLDRGLRWIPLGTALILGLTAADVLLVLLSLTGPDTDFELINAVSTLIQLLAWSV